MPVAGKPIVLFRAAPRSLCLIQPIASRDVCLGLSALFTLQDLRKPNSFYNFLIFKRHRMLARILLYKSQIAPVE